LAIVLVTGVPFSDSAVWHSFRDELAANPTAIWPIDVRHDNTILRISRPGYREALVCYMTGQVQAGAGACARCKNGDVRGASLQQAHSWDDEVDDSTNGATHGGRIPEPRLSRLECLRAWNNLS
jgi:hypothetical protein